MYLYMSVGSSKTTASDLPESLALLWARKCLTRPGREDALMIGWHYLSNATCLIRPRLFYALFIVSRIIMIC